MENGESPKGIDINELQCEKVGCNAIFQITVHHLVCCDKRMVTEGLQTHSNKNIHTRSDWQNLFRVNLFQNYGTNQKKELINLGIGEVETMQYCWQVNQQTRTIKPLGSIHSVKMARLITFTKVPKTTINPDSHAVDPSLDISSCPKYLNIIQTNNMWCMPKAGNTPSDMWKSIKNVKLENLDNIIQKSFAEKR